MYHQYNKRKGLLNFEQTFNLNIQQSGEVYQSHKRRKFIPVCPFVDHSRTRKSKFFCNLFVGKT